MEKGKVTSRTLEKIISANFWLPVLSILLGALLWSVSINGILVHHEFISGGISGLALVIYYIFPKVSIGLMVFLINIPLFIIGWRMISGKFFFLSLLGMSSFSLFLVLTTDIHIRVENPLLATIFAGVISGCGSGLIFRAGSSGGGTGIIAMILNRRLSMRVGIVSTIINSIPLVLEPYLSTWMPPSIPLFMFMSPDQCWTGLWPVSTRGGASLLFLPIPLKFRSRFSPSSIEG